MRLSGWRGWLALACGLGLSVVLVSGSLIWNHSDRQRQFNLETGGHEQLLSVRVQQTSAAIATLATLFVADQYVDADQFRLMAEGLFDRWPFLTSVFFAARVRSADLADFQAMVRDQGYPGFEVLPARAAESYYPIRFFEPFEPLTARFMGVDLTAYPHYAHAIQDAVSSDRTVLVSGNSPIDTTKAIWFLSPLYAGRSSPAASRRKQLAKGVVGLAIDFRQLVQGLHASGDGLHLDIRTPSRILPLLTILPRQGHINFQVSSRYTLPIADRKLDVEFTRKLALGDLISMATAVALALGLSTTGLFLLLAGHSAARSRAEQALRRSHAELEQRVVERTAELQRSEALLETTGHTANVGGWELDVETKTARWTRHIFHIFELPEGKVPDLETTMDYFPEEDRAKLNDALQRAIESGEPYDLEVRFITAKGKRLWIRTKGIPEQRDGKTVMLRGTFQDISDRKAAEFTIQQSRKRLEEAQRLARLGNWELDHRNNALTWSDEIFHIFEIDKTRFAASYAAFLDAVHPEDRERVDRTYLHSLETREPYAITHRLLMADGRVKFVNEQCETFYDGEGQPIRSVGTVQDVTERVVAENELKNYRDHLKDLVAARTAELQKAKEAVEATNEELRLFKLLAEKSAQGIGMATMDLNPFYYNNRLKEMLGISSRATPAGTFLVYYPDWARKLIDEQVIPSLHRNGYWTGELALTNLATKAVTATLESFILIRGQDDRPLYIMDMMTDISKQKDNEAELTRAKEAAEAASCAKSIFLANMSHELRTPLNAILGFSQLMAEDRNLPADHRKNLQVVNRSGRHLLSLINDVLDISKIESGRLHLTTETVDLHELLAALTDAMQVRARQKGLALYYGQSVEVPRFIDTDPTKLRQIVTNLLSNALKYTSRGEVRVRVDAERVQGKTLLTIAVSDTGIGIAEQDLEHIFDAFFQTEAGQALGEGTGLGLRISKEYSRLLNGELTVESMPGHGSTFRFRLPVKETEAPAEAVHPSEAVIGLAPDQPGYRILVAEDNEDNQLLISSLLKKAGFLVRIAVNGRQAVECVHTWKPDLIWMDMRMPIMDGYEATRRIKASPGGAQIPIVALTASVFEEDRAPIFEAGCDDLVRKPVTAQELFRVIREQLGVRYLHARQPPQAGRSVQIDPAAIAELPRDEKQALTDAAEQLDQEAVSAVITQVAERFPTLADALRQLAADYRFDLIVDALKKD